MCSRGGLSEARQRQSTSDRTRQHLPSIELPGGDVTGGVGGDHAASSPSRLLLQIDISRLPCVGQ